MKKNFFLTLMLGLLCIATGRAQFAPEAGKMYALQEVTSGLYLDIQTGVYDANNQFSNCLSLNTDPCVIYFAAGTTDNTKWTMKNVNGTYAMQGTNHWIANIGETQYEWTILEPETGVFTIARADGKYIGVDSPANGACLYCDRGTGLQFHLMEYTDSYELGNIQSAADLMSVTTATHIAVKNLTSTNNYYFAGTSSAQNFEDAILVLEPVTEGTAGSYYLRTTDATNGYIQQAAAGTNVSLGTKDAAQVFYTVEPTSSGSSSTYFNDVNGLQNADTDNLVRFVKSDATAWLNCQGSGSTPKYTGGTAYGTWTVHNVYAVTVTQELSRVVSEDTDPYVLLKTATGTYMNLTKVSNTAVSFQATSTKFVLEPSSDDTGYYIKVKGTDPVTYIVPSTSNIWDVTTSTTAHTWLISEPDNDGYVTISHANGNLGSDNNTNAGTGIYANVGVGCNKWLIKEYNPLPVTYTFRIENPTGQEVSATYNGNAITEGETIEIEGMVDASLFGANDIEGYAWKVVVKRYARTITLVYGRKYTLSIVDAPNDVAVTYNGNEVTTGSYLGVEYDTQYLTVTSPNGYTWAVTRDDDNKTVTITFTQLQAEENPQAVVDLLNRIGGDGTADKFKIVLDPSLNYTAEQFSIGGEDGKVLIKGTTLSAITTGIGWYLQNIAHINISWNSLNEKTVSGGAYADLSGITAPTTEEVHTSDAKYRYYLNYCTFGYSMTTWTWNRWQQEIDWMALHGVNMPLQIVGLEEVWRKFLTMEDENGAHKYNYTDEEAKAFVPGPAFTAWWGMNNLQGWGGTASTGWGGVQDDDWYTRQQQLATQILTRQRELGMQPVLPGFSGMVPSDFQTKTGVTCDAGTWCGFERPKIVLPTNDRFSEIAADYYKCLEEVMGTSQYYSIDPFHEGGAISGGTTEQYNAAYRVIYDAMEVAKPGSQWVIQQWQWYNNTYQRLSVSALPEGRLIVLDLFSDGRPGFDSYGTDGGYAPQDAVFCAIPNFGGRSGLMGRLNSIVDNYYNYKGKYSTIKGVGAAPEAIEQTPVTYDLIFQLPWMNGVKPDVAEWIENYSVSRYGVEDDDFKDAWELLRQGPLNYGADAIEGPVEDVWAAIPNLSGNKASAWGKSLSDATAANTYTRERRQMLIDATYKLLSKNNKISGDIYLSNYNYDLVEFGGGVLADYAYDLLLGISAAKTAAGSGFETDATYIARRDAFLALIEDVDGFKGTNLNFRLGKWTQEARDAAAEAVALGATTANADWYEYNNARTLITTWGDYSQSVAGGQALLRDYSYRSWQGLMKDVYLRRWQHYFDNGCTGAGSGYFYFSWNWAHGMDNEPADTQKSSTALVEGEQGYSYTREPEGNTVEKATEVLGKYIIPIKADNGAYYAYRYLGTDINNFTAAVITIPKGADVDLSKYLGDLTSAGSKTVTVAGDAFEDTTNFAAVTVKADAEGNSTVTVTVSDGTALTFTVNAVAADYFTAKESLAALIEDMEELTALVGTFNPVGTVTEVVGLTAEGTAGTTDLYVWTNAQEDSEGPIKNLVDGSVDTHFHSEYSTNVGANHFVNVDLGSTNALSSFIFSYATRKANTDFPKTIVVSGCNEREGTYEYIATITDLPEGNASSSITFISDRISCGKEYAYLRFTVTANNSNNKEAGGHPYFHMAELNLYNASTTATLFPEFEDTELTNEFAAEKYDVLLNAIAVNKLATTAAEINTAKGILQTAYDELKEKYDAVVKPEEPVVLGPITITTDEEHPVLYNIISGRYENNDANNDHLVLKYDKTDGKVALTTLGENNIYQAWYFMLGSADGSVLMKPFNANGAKLGATDVTNGANKVSTSENNTYYEWFIVDSPTTGWYNIYTVVDESKYYFSNFGGIENKMGFWDGDANESQTKSDGGSQFQFIEAEFGNDNARYYQLEDLLSTMDITKQAMSGDAPGCRDGGDAHFDAYTAAAGYINEGNTADADDCYAAYTTLRATSAALGEMKMPEPGEVYRIKNFIALGITGQKYHYIANNNAAISFPTEADNSTTLWVCVAGENGTYKFVSAMGTATLGWQKAAGKDDIQEFSIETGVERGAVALNNSGVNLSLRNEAHDKGLGFDQASNNVTAQVVDWSTDWLLEPVEDVVVSYARTLGIGYRWGTLFLPYAVEVPAGITAYYATLYNVGETTITLTDVGTTIPSYTPVLICRSVEDSKSRTDYDFTLTADVQAIGGNIFEGSILTSYIECQENYRYYLLLNASKGEAFYWIKHEYNEYGGSDDTHIKCDANKAYLSVDTSSVSPSSYYRFEFEDGSTTGIEELESENGKAETIYDLQGRRLTEITEPGVYIIDGNKVLVK